MKFVYSIALLILLAACAGTPNLAPTGDVDADMRALSDFAIADLKAANELAVAANDEKAKACYPALIEYVQSLQVYRDVANTSEKTEGVFVTYQRARNIRRGFDNGVPESVEIRCSALFNDSRAFVTRMLTRLGVKAALPVPGL